MRRTLLLSTLFVAAMACRQYDPLFCEKTADCEDPARPFCDVSGEFPASEGIGKTCIADPLPDAGLPPDAGPSSQCEAGAFVQCVDADSALFCDQAGAAFVAVDCASECDANQGGCYCEPSTSTCATDTELRCDAAGTATVRSCALGCDATGARCVDVNPSNSLGTYLDMTEAAPIVTLLDGAVIDTDAGTIENGDGSAVIVPSFQVAAPAGGVALRVFAVRSLSIGDTTATGSRALAIVSDGDILIGGELRIEAGRGPGGACDGGRGNVSGSMRAGAGGGGFGSEGGIGGIGRDGTGAAVAPGVRGLSVGNASLVPLRGGCSGGRVNADTKAANGGGALQLVSRTAIRLDGASQRFINAGGKAGGPLEGGGAGGGILLEAPVVVVASGTGLVANGGGGGCNDTGGEDGQLSATPASGASCPQGDEGDGGDGAVASAGGGGQAALIAGSGGGGVGQIRVNVPVAADLRLFGVTSPVASVGTLSTR